MTVEAFVSRSFSVSSKVVIAHSLDILDAYAAQGYDLSLRQLYYQHVSRNWLANTEQNYKRLGSIINDARLAGLIDWDMIKDRGRASIQNSHWTSPKQILGIVARQFAADKWETQPNHVEVMVEKQALEGVLVPVCRELDVPFSANKGYSSATAMYETSKRMLAAQSSGKDVYVLYLGDHDPSGIDMTRDVFSRLGLFTRDLDESVLPEDYDDGEGGFDATSLQVKRLALNMSQVDEYDPPPNPAKLTDSRSNGYIERFGNESWELDALEPSVLAGLVREAVESVRDEELWAEATEKEERMKGYLQELSDNYKEAS